METGVLEQVPFWDNSTEYKGLFSDDFHRDIETAEKLLQEIEVLNKCFDSFTREKIATLQEISLKGEKAIFLIQNISSFSRCEKSIDSKNDQAIKACAKGSYLWSAFNMAMTPLELFLKQCDEETLEAYLNSEHTSNERFVRTYDRKLKDYSLSSAEEKTLTQFENFGPNAWGDLYSAISGSLKVNVSSVGEVGLAQAAGYLRGPDEAIRKDAWQAIQTSWKQVEVSTSAVLNNLVGHRVELYKKRSHTNKMHFLDLPLHDSRITKPVLDAMLGAIQDKIDIPRRAQRAMAKALGKSKLDPWDILAPSPRLGHDKKYSFSDAMAMITEAFRSVDPQMGDFVEMMAKNKWIEAGVRPNKSSGAYCTGFLKSDTPRVFQTYMGSMKDISTLAHELGHAYHSWAMRGIPFAKSHYPVTVAETASIFSETLLSERLFERASVENKFTIAWEDASDALSMLVNIPARYEFEKSLYEARQKGPLSPAELNALTDKAWRKWYGEDLSQTEEQYWMTKMHFSFSGISFYNYPYTFGYLFSLGIYALREKLGPNFHKAYVEILRDSGSMTAEDLVKKHLGADIRQKEFWLQSLGIIEGKVTRFELLI